MRLVILDPNLVDTHGHHALYDRVIAAEAGRRDSKTVILANRAFGRAQLDDIPVHPLLETTCYRQFSKDPLFGTFDDVEQGNRAVFGEMSALPADFFHRSDLVVVHTVSQITLMGLVSWIATLPATNCPRFCIFLMLPSGIGFGPDGAVDMDNPAAATAYREAFRRVREANLDVVFFASGHQHARQFSALSGIDIPSHALLTGFDETPAQVAVRENQVLLFAGDAKMNKGLGLLPDLVAHACPAHPEHEFIIHANPGPAWGEALEVVETLRMIAPNHPNLDLRLAPLPSQDYADLLTSSAIVLLPYDPQEYRRKSSGVVWEAIASESQLVVPQNTWLDSECAHWGAAHETYAPNGAGAALERAIRGLANAREQAVQATRRFDAANGVKALFDQLADCWVARGAGHGTSAGQTSTILPADFGADGWHAPEKVGDDPVCWSSATATLRQILPGLGDWSLTLKGLFHFSTEQLQGAHLLVDGTEYPTRFTAAEDGAWTLSCLFGETRPDMPERAITLRLDWTQTGGDDPRELGLLAQSLTISEEHSRAGWTNATLHPVKGQTPPDADGWSGPFTHASWTGDLQSSGDCVIGFAAEGTLSPDEAAQMQVFANGQPIPVRLYRDGDWQAQVCLPAATTQGHIELDITLPLKARIRMRPLVWTQENAATRVADPHNAAPDATPDQGTTPPPDPEPVPDPEPEQSAAAPATTPATPDQDIATDALWTCDSQETFDTMSFINLRISGFSLGHRMLEDFHVKILRGQTYLALELRDLDNAFQLVDQPNPDQVHNDDWGAVIRLFADHNGTCTGAPPHSIAAGTEGLMALIATLPSGVANCNLPKGITKEWQAAAQALTRAFMPN